MPSNKRKYAEKYGMGNIYAVPPFTSRNARESLSAIGTLVKTDISSKCKKYNTLKTTTTRKS